jgi:hypothetical protein
MYEVSLRGFAIRTTIGAVDVYRKPLRCGCTTRLSVWMTALVSRATGAMTPSGDSSTVMVAPAPPYNTTIGFVGSGP